MITIPSGAEIYFNIAVVVLYLVFVIIGIKKGFLFSVISAAASVLSLLFSWRYCRVLAEYIHIWPSSLNPFKDSLYGDVAYSFLNDIAWFIILFIVLRIIFLILEKLASGLQKLPGIKQLSGMLGALLGGVNATVFIIVVCVILNTPLFSNGAEYAQNTFLGPIADTTGQVFKKVGAPLNVAEAFQKAAKDINSVDDKDQEVLRQWLESHGFDKENTDSISFSENTASSQTPAAEGEKE